MAREIFAPDCDAGLGRLVPVRVVVDRVVFLRTCVHPQGALLIYVCGPNAVSGNEKSMSDEKDRS